MRAYVRGAVTSLILALVPVFGPGVAAIAAPSFVPASGTLHIAGADDDDQALDAAAEQAQNSGKPVEVPGLTSETTRVVAEPDGSVNAEITPLPVRVRRDDQWVPVDRTWQQQPDGSYSPAAFPADITAGRPGSDEVVAFMVDGERVAVRWPSTLPAAEVSGDSLVYPQVAPGVDLGLRVTDQGVATYVVVRTPEAARNPLVRNVPLAVAGQDVKVQSDGAGAVVTRQGVRVLSLSGAAAWSGAEANAAGQGLLADEPDSPADALPALATPPDKQPLQPVAVKVQDQAVTLATDPKLLAAPPEKFPLVIDPQIYPIDNKASGFGSWERHSDGGTAPFKSSLAATIGYQGWEADTYYSRHYWSFPLGALKGLKVDAATLVTYLSWAPKWSPSGKCEPDKDLGRQSLLYEGNVPTGPGFPRTGALIAMSQNSIFQNCQGEQPFDVSNAVRSHVAGGRLVVELRAQNESDPIGWRQYSKGPDGRFPVIRVRLKTPLRVSNINPLNFDVNHMNGASKWAPQMYDTSTPAFWVAPADPDAALGAGGTMTVEFELWHHTGVRVDSYRAAGSVLTGQAMRYTVPVGVAKDLEVYFVRARAVSLSKGAAPSPWSPYLYFRVSTAPPAPPSLVFHPYDGSVSVTSPSASVDPGIIAYKLQGPSSSAWITVPSTGTASFTLPGIFTTSGIVSAVAVNRVNHESAPTQVAHTVDTVAPVHRWTFDPDDATPDPVTALSKDSGSWPMGPLRGIPAGAQPVPGGNDTGFDLAAGPVETEMPAIPTTGAWSLGVSARFEAGDCDGPARKVVAEQRAGTGFVARIGCANSRWWAEVQAADGSVVALDVAASVQEATGFSHATLVYEPGAVPQLRLMSQSNVSSVVAPSQLRSETASSPLVLGGTDTATRYAGVVDSVSVWHYAQTPDATHDQNLTLAPSRGH